MQEMNDRERVISTFVFRRRKRTQYRQQEHRRVQQLGNLKIDAQSVRAEGNYTPYRVANLSWMTGGKVETCAAQPASSCCLNPCSKVWNMLFNSGEGAFQRMIELQNQRRLCDDKKKIKAVVSNRTKMMTRRHPHTLAIPAGLVCTSVHKPLNALSFSSLSLISYNA